MTQAQTKDELALTAKPDTDTRKALNAKGDAVTRQLQADMARARKGDRNAMDAVRKALTAIQKDWEKIQDTPDVVARNLLVEATFGEDLLQRETFARQAEAMKRELAGPNPTPLELALAARVATCWLDANLSDMMFGYRLIKGANLAIAEHHERRRDRAHQRYVSAVLALARARRLLLPVMQQVNIAQPGAQQLNLAAGQLPQVPQNAGESGKSL